MTKNNIQVFLTVFVTTILAGWVFSTMCDVNTHPYLEHIVQLIEPMFTQKKTYTGTLSMLNERNPLNEVSIYTSKTKSYAVNKTDIYLVVYDYQRNNYYDANTVIFVLLHELAHVLCDEVGHTKNYYDIFNGLLNEATQLGIYSPNTPVDKNYPTTI